ncbi:MAG: EscU/YscU/HrcU family type III secretion system export apparatus switch protein [Spirochaetes bacterium]|nr:EscU/YscU/HrcU family type III secretion system export apparatus switch protein [Spirochaetota bacterium]
MKSGERKAVALEYSGGEGAPAIVAMARGILVEKLLELAEEYNIPVYRDADLAEALDAMNVGDEVPEDLFRAVAEVFAYCYRVNARFRDKMVF